jgi:hypothetical protein
LIFFLFEIQFLDRQKFINDLANNPRNVLSPMDAEIQRNCDSLIKTLPLAPDMLDSKGIDCFVLLI